MTQRERNRLCRKQSAEELREICLSPREIDAQSRVPDDAPTYAWQVHEDVLKFKVNVKEYQSLSALPRSEQLLGTKILHKQSLQIFFRLGLR